MIHDADSLEALAKRLEKRASHMKFLADKMRNSPNLPTEAASQILQTAGFGVLHGAYLTAILGLIAQAKEQDTDLPDGDYMHGLEEAVKLQLVEIRRG